MTLLERIDQNETKLTWLIEKEKELPVLQKRMQEFEREYSVNDSISVRDKLTAYISDYAEKNKILVVEIPNNSFYKGTNLNVQTNSFTIKGNFKLLLVLLSELEKNFRYISKVMSARFYTTRENQNKSTALYLTVITQSFEQGR